MADGYQPLNRRSAALTRSEFQTEELPKSRLTHYPFWLAFLVRQADNHQRALGISACRGFWFKGR